MDERPPPSRTKSQALSGLPKSTFTSESSEAAPNDLGAPILQFGCAAGERFMLKNGTLDSRIWRRAFEKIQIGFDESI